MVKDWRNEQIAEANRKSKDKKYARISSAEIARRTGLSESAVRNVFKGGNTETETLILICLAMHLPYEISQFLLDHSPKPLRLTNNNNVIYDFVLKYYYPEPVSRVKKIIEKLGGDPL